MATDIIKEHVVPVLGNCVAVAMLCSPLPAVLHIRRTGSLEDFNMLPYPLTVCNCVGWVCYALSNANAYVFPANIVGFLGGLFFTFTAFECAARKLRDQTMAIILLCTAHFIALGMVDVYALDDKEAEKMWGINAVVILMFYYLIPLSTMITVVKTKNASSIYPPLAISAIINGSLWTIYGFAIADFFLWMPNLFGAVLAVLQLALRLRYGRGAAPTQSQRFLIEDHEQQVDAMERAARLASQAARIHIAVDGEVPPAAGQGQSFAYQHFPGTPTTGAAPSLPPGVHPFKDAQQQPHAPPLGELGKPRGKRGLLAGLFKGRAGGGKDGKPKSVVLVPTMSQQYGSAVHLLHPRDLPGGTMYQPPTPQQESSSGAPPPVSDEAAPEGAAYDGSVPQPQQPGVPDAVACPEVEGVLLRRSVNGGLTDQEKGGSAEAVGGAAGVRAQPEAQRGSMNGARPPRLSLQGQGEAVPAAVQPPRRSAPGDRLSANGSGAAAGAGGMEGPAAAVAAGGALANEPRQPEEADKEHEGVVYEALAGEPAGEEEAHAQLASDHPVQPAVPAQRQSNGGVAAVAGDKAGQPNGE